MKERKENWLTLRARVNFSPRVQEGDGARKTALTRVDVGSGKWVIRYSGHNAARLGLTPTWMDRANYIPHSAALSWHSAVRHAEQTRATGGGVRASEY